MTFDLELAKKTMTAQTMDGRKVRILCTDRYDEKSIVGILDNQYQDVFEWHSSGLAHEDGRLRGIDLINVPVPKKKISGWININPYREIQRFIFRSKKEADISKFEGRIACIHIEFEEGGGLE